jgi:hypothetical protein
MDLNTIGISFIGIIILYLVYTSWITPIEVIPMVPGFLVAQDTGKTHHIQSKTGDASISIESKRRLTIQTIGRENPVFNALNGSVSGVIETYHITRDFSSKCPTYGIIYDGGGVDDEFCPIQGSKQYDAGNSKTNIITPRITILSGGGADDEFCPAVSDTYDGGTSKTRVCGI